MRWDKELSYVVFGGFFFRTRATGRNYLDFFTCRTCYDGSHPGCLTSDTSCFNSSAEVSELAATTKTDMNHFEKWM
jgi:hypothetical protein